MITTRPKKILVIMSDTGGGHRAAAEAIQTAATIRYPNLFEFTLVDVFREYTPFPFKYAPEIYPAWVNYGARLWGLIYRLTNGRIRSRFFAQTLYLTWQRGLRKMLAKYEADLILDVHAILTRPVMKAVQEMPNHPPFITVVTDLVSTHAFWYTRQADRCLVPTQSAYQRGLDLGMSTEQMRVTGLPVHPKFTEDLTGKPQARQELGLDPELPAVLVVSGGEGMGPLDKIAVQINERRLPCQLLVVAGRNNRLQEKLSSLTWNQPTTVFGYVDFMPRLMAAADLIITKAGPATITEACVAGLPIILSGAVPGQEDGNVSYVVDNQAGVYAPGPRKVADAVAIYLKDRDRLQILAQNAAALARPQAAWDIVDEIYTLACSPHAVSALDPVSAPPENQAPVAKSTLQHLA